MLRMGRMCRIWWTFGLAVGCSTAGVRDTFAAVKTDIVELVNGDRITCEIKKLDRGKLTVKTDGLGTLSIEWDDIQHISSKARYDVQLASGTGRSARLSGPTSAPSMSSRARKPNGSRSGTS